MARELERAGIPTAQICTMVNVAKGMGVSRVVASRSVLHPTGAPDLDPAEEFVVRRRIVGCALAAVRTEVREPTVVTC